MSAPKKSAAVLRREALRAEIEANAKRMNTTPARRSTGGTKRKDIR